MEFRNQVGIQQNPNLNPSIRKHCPVLLDKCLDGVLDNKFKSRYSGMGEGVKGDKDKVRKTKKNTLGKTKREEKHIIRVKNLRGLN